jgi:HlyD family secretion protein
MNARADIKTKRMDNVLSVPINSVAARVRGSDKTIAEKKKEEKKKQTTTEGDADENIAVDESELEEVVFVIQKDGKVKKIKVKTGIQDVNYIEIKEGLAEGDQVVTAPFNSINKTLKDGSTVKVVSQEDLYDGN